MLIGHSVSNECEQTVSDILNPEHIHGLCWVVILEHIRSKISWYRKFNYASAVIYEIYAVDIRNAGCADLPFATLLTSTISLKKKEKKNGKWQHTPPHNQVILYITSWERLGGTGALISSVAHKYQHTNPYICLCTHVPHPFA